VKKIASHHLSVFSLETAGTKTTFFFFLVSDVCESLPLPRSFLSPDEVVTESQCLRRVICVSLCPSTFFLPAVLSRRVWVSGLRRSFRTGLISSSRKLRGLREAEATAMHMKPRAAVVSHLSH